MTRDEEKQTQAKVVEKIVKLTKGKARLDDVLPQVIDKHKCPSLYLEWMVEKFWGLQSPKLMVELNKLYDGLVEKKHTERKKFNCNDGDDNAWYMPCKVKGRRVMCHTTQNRNHLYVWEESRYPDDRPDLHIRRFYDVYDKERHGWSDDKDLMTVQEAIDKAEHYHDKFADVTYQYARRYTLKAYKKANFQMQYGDGRDAGYVGSYDGWKGDVHWAMSHHTELKLIHECFIPSLCCELFEGDKEKQICHTIGGYNDDKGYDSWPKVEYNL